MEKWWKVKRGVALTETQQKKAVDFLMDWITRQLPADRGTVPCR